MISLPMIKETAEQRYTRLFEEMYEICNTEGWGDPFSYARSREIHMAGILGHRVADDYSGADAYDKYDLPVEYQSTIGKKLTATYNGISVQDTWEKQVEYILNEKIGKYHHHYFARYEDGKIVEVWRLTAKQVYDKLLPNLERQFHSKKVKKDPRLGYTLSEKYIYSVGLQII